MTSSRSWRGTAEDLASRPWTVLVSVARTMSPSFLRSLMVQQKVKQSFKQEKKKWSCPMAELHYRHEEKRISL
jgi:hypothetical protein